jgi:hypothetical protein
MPEATGITDEIGGLLQSLSDRLKEPVLLLAGVITMAMYEKVKFVCRVRGLRSVRVDWYRCSGDSGRGAYI